MSSSSESETKKLSEIATKRVTRSSKRTSKVIVRNIAKEKVSPQKAKKTNSIKKKPKGASESSNNSGEANITKAPRGRGRPKKSTTTTRPKGRSQPQYRGQSPSKKQWASVHSDTVLKTRGRGSSGRGRGTRGRVGKNTQRTSFFWGKAPPTAADLAKLGQKDGCSYVLSKRGRGNSRGYRAHLEAEIAVANLYDSD